VVGEVTAVVASKKALKAHIGANSQVLPVGRLISDTKIELSSATTDWAMTYELPNGMTIHDLLGR